MKNTLPLAVRMRQLLSRIHPPLPTTARESQQLLSVLQTAFRNRLDEAYPAPGESNKEQVPVSTSSSLATHHYLNTILTHPLLEQQHGYGVANRAVASFDGCLAEGVLNKALVANCISQYNTGLGKGELIPDQARLGLRLNAWLNSVNADVRASFFQDSKLLNNATRLVAEDGHEEIAWDWLRRLYERDGLNASIQDHQWLSVEDNLVGSLMRISIRRNDLSDAAQQYGQACQYRIQSLRPALPMETSFKRLAAAMIQRRSEHGVGNDMFEQVLKYGLGWMNSPHLNKCVLQVYHPTSPKAEPLYERLRSTHHAEAFISSQRGKQARKHMMVMLLDTVQLCLNQQQRAKAEFMLDFAIDHYPEFLPARQEKEVEPQLLVSSQHAFG